jgi:hypothetical protein
MIDLSMIFLKLETQQENSPLQMKQQAEIFKWQGGRVIHICQLVYIHPIQLLKNVPHR